MSKSHTFLALHSHCDTLAETLDAFQVLGHTLILIDVRPYISGTSPAAELLDKLLQYRGQVDAIFTINMLGFDAQGVMLEALAAASIPVISWEIDHPYFFESFGLRAVTPSENLCLFLWDEGYLDDMRDRGHQQVYYLPNATNPTCLNAMAKLHQGDFPRFSSRGVFVGSNLLSFIKSFLDSELTFNLFPSDQHILFCQKLLEKLLLNSSQTFMEVAPEIADSLNVDLSGGIDSERRLLLYELLVSSDYRIEMLKRCQTLEVFGGSEWQGIVPDARYHGTISYYKALAALYRESLAVVNVTLAKNRYDANQRIFDVPAVGGFVLTDRKRNLEKHFEIGQELIVYDDAEEVESLIQFYQKHDAARLSIIEKAQARIEKQHTYKSRIAELVSTWSAI